MTFPVEILAGRFAFLIRNLLLLLPDPAELRDGKQADGVKIHSKRRGDTHLSSGRVNAQMNVLDIFFDDIHGDIAELDGCGHQYSFCCLTIRKMRSTSDASCKTSYRAL